MMREEEQEGKVVEEDHRNCLLHGTNSSKISKRDRLVRVGVT
jgi:hypothetical protein